MDKALKILGDMLLWAFGEGAIAFCVRVICEAIILFMPETTKAWGIASFISPIAFWLGVAGGCVCAAAFGIYLLLAFVDKMTK